MTTDPITLEVLRHGFRAICNESSALLARVAYAPTITEGHDYSGSLLTGDAKLISHGQKDQAAHLGTFEASLRTIKRAFPDPQPEDVFIFNDPYDGGSHQPDIKVLRPIFADGKLIAYGASCGHWPDVGGPVPGTFNPRATSSFAEGLRVPPTLLQRGGETIASTIQLLEANVRQPAERMADLYGQVQATKLMETRMLEYVERFGVETVLTAMSASFERSGALLRAAVQRIPDGTYSFTDYGVRVVHVPPVRGGGGGRGGGAPPPPPHPGGAGRPPTHTPGPQFKKAVKPAARATDDKH